MTHFNKSFLNLALVLLLFVASSVQLMAFPDLEDLRADFVLETKRIEIPGYPHAFNPSVIRWHGKLLMSFRIIPNPLFTFSSHIGLVWLNEDFSLAGPPQIIDTLWEKGFFSPITPSRLDDARLVEIGSKLYIVYSNNEDILISRGGFRVYLAELQFNGERFTVHNIEKLWKFEGESCWKREKNWVPFDYQGQMLLAYSLTPHLIFRPLLLGTGECETVVSTEKTVSWEWGELRGGTPALRLNDEEFLAFFHSSVRVATVHSGGKTMPHYFMGAYTFSSTPPFALTRVSPQPIVGENFYYGEIYKPYWGSVRAVFPGGFTQDEEYIWVFYGRQDHEVWFAKISKAGLLNGLVVLP